MRKLIFAAMAAVTIIGSSVSAVGAAPYVPCEVGAFRQHDMAGSYAAQDMRLTIYACGGSYMVWRNAFGSHESGYVGIERLPGGGIIAKGWMGDPVSGVYLDSTQYIVYKPAEPGYIEVFTYDYISASFIGVYRLRKVA